MELRRIDPTKKEYAPRTVFSLIGTLLKETEKSILVQMANAKTKFWIDKNGGEPSVEEGEFGAFQITISTYIGKEGDLIWTKLRMQSALKIGTEIQNDHPGFVGWMEGKITSYFQTDIENLWVVNFETNQGEKFILRYYSKKKPLVKSCEMEFNLKSTSKLVSSEGGVYEATRNIAYNDKTTGEDIKKEVKRWFPCLEAGKIKYLR